MSFLHRFGNGLDLSAICIATSFPGSLIFQTFSIHISKLVLGENLIDY